METLSRIRRQTLFCFLANCIFSSFCLAPGLWGQGLWGQSPRLGQSKGEIPEALSPWRAWALWDVPPSQGPPPFDDPNQHLRVWPSVLRLEVFADRAQWQFKVEVYDDGWVEIPGEIDVWPQNVRSESGALPVLLRNDHPAVHLKAGSHQLRGEFRWSDIPQKLMLPQSIGIISLQRDGSEVALPNWDTAGILWLNRQQPEEAQQNLLSIKVYRLLEDGIPLWLRSQLELSVSGKSREEDLGCILPDGWQLASIESQLPVAVDEQGQMRVQVRPGTWKVELIAFRTSDFKQFQYAAGVRPIVATELIGFQSKPAIRVAEIEGLQAIDVQQTTYPDNWRSWPVYQWSTDASFKLIEKMRGQGAQKPKGLTVERHFWLDDDGKGLTFQDRLSGQLQQAWRLDIADSHELGVVRIDQQRQLITSNPVSGNQGVEIRSRNPRLEALGRIERSDTIPATGWLADVDFLRLKLSLPPGWRVLTVLGADNVDGDWLTAWTLLDLFLVLIFSLAVYRLWGIPAGLLALIAFGLSYHEPGSPRWTWLFLLMPVALLSVIGEGVGKRWLNAWRYLALGLILLNLLPFIAQQVQVLLYPQLEPVGVPYRQRVMFPWIGATYELSSKTVDAMREDAPSWRTDSSVAKAQVERKMTIDQDNLAFDPAARTQTGPARPEWSGNEISCSWSGPVTIDQQISPIYISRTAHRILIFVRCVLLLLLAAVLCGLRLPLGLIRKKRNLPGAATGAMVLLMWVISANNGQAQFPDQGMLDKLRERLLETSDAFPNAANIADLVLAVQDGKLSMDLEIHSAAEVAVPLPGKLPLWSPISVDFQDAVTADSAPVAETSNPASSPSKVSGAIVCRRQDGHLWVIVPSGVHKLRVVGNLADSNEWVLAFPLVPKHITVTAPQWQVVGLKSSGLPESQLFFSKVEKSNEDQVLYDQRIYKPIVLVERRLEIGLNWKIQTKVTRLSALGKAISLKIPLIAGERVVSSTTEMATDTMDVNLAADQAESTWDSAVEITDKLTLKAADSEAQALGENTASRPKSNGDYVEKWVLVSSPVWNITHLGPAPIYETTAGDLIPVWHVWPGEQLTLEIRRPKAISGQNLTVRKIAQATSLGARQRNTTLEMEVESSIGGDFVIDIEPEADITSLTVNKRKQPVRRNAAQLIVPLQPGLQQVDVSWELKQPLQTKVMVDAVKLPVSGANVTTILEVPENRWIIWASGPLRGPAVRLWIFLATAVFFALLLGGQRLSPLKRYEWVLLALGLTQVHVSAVLIVVAWLLVLGWRGQTNPFHLVRWQFNFMQILIVLLTVVVFGIFLVVVGKGLLGNPEMFVAGNGSYNNYLNWFEPKTRGELPQPSIISVSIWFYRLAMLLWALWLASALLRWLQKGWLSFSTGGRWRSPPSKFNNVPSGNS